MHSAINSVKPLNIVWEIKSRRRRWGRACSAYGRQGKFTQGYSVETWGKRPLGRPTRRWEENIKMELQDVELGGMGLIDLTLDRDRWRALVNAVMNLFVP